MKKLSDRKAAPLPTPDGERIAKVMARAGLCSRREAESWIAAGRVAVNGKTITSPALNIGPADRVVVDGQPLPSRERTRLFLYHKPRGLVTTHQDPEGRPTIFAALPKSLPRLISVGRLDLNTEGLLLLTNDGGLARVLELPATGWLRRYRVRALGSVTQAQLNELRAGVTIEGIRYGSIEATLDRVKSYNSWITFAIREGKNREVRNVLGHLGLSVNRLIRVSFGPFQLGELGVGAIEEVRTRVLRDQLGESIAADAEADFVGPIVQRQEADEEIAAPPRRPRAPGRGQPEKIAPRIGREPRKTAKGGNKSPRAETDREWRPKRGGTAKKFTKNRRFAKGGDPSAPAASKGPRKAGGPLRDDRQSTRPPRAPKPQRKKARRAMDR